MEDRPEVGVLIGQNCRALREEQLHSRRELAEMAGISEVTIAKLELGRVPHPRRATVAPLAEALGVPFEELARPKAEAPSPDSPEERRSPVLIEAEGGVVAGSSADLFEGQDEQFRQIVAPLEERGMDPDEIGRLVGAKAKRVAAR